LPPLQLYTKRFSDYEQHLGFNVILGISYARDFRETGSLLSHWRHAGVPLQRRVIDKEKILRAFEKNPGTACALLH